MNSTTAGIAALLQEEKRPVLDSIGLMVTPRVPPPHRRRTSSATITDNPSRISLAQVATVLRETMTGQHDWRELLDWITGTARVPLAAAARVPKAGRAATDRSEATPRHIGAWTSAVTRGLLLTVAASTYLSSLRAYCECSLRMTSKMRC